MGRCDYITPTWMPEIPTSLIAPRDDAGWEESPFRCTLIPIASAKHALDSTGSPCHGDYRIIPNVSAEVPLS